MKGRIKHYALIPAKKKSGRCRNKNWRNFIKEYSLVDFTLKNLPNDIFTKVILSTDKTDYNAPRNVEIHLRDKNLARENSSITDLIKVIIDEYKMEDKEYLWSLNPTSPFRFLEDFRRIMVIIEKDMPSAVVSAVKINPFIWSDTTPLFETKGKRRNTQNFAEEYAVENGMFYVMNVGYFRRNNTWYGKDIKLYKQDTIWASVDIDTEEHFTHAQEIGKLWKESLAR